MKRFPLGSRSINKRGQHVAERLAWAEDVLGAEREFPDWVEEGQEIVADLRAASHGHLAPQSLQEERVRHWQRYGRNMESGAKLHGMPVVSEWLPSHPDVVQRVVDRLPDA